MLQHYIEHFRAVLGFCNGQVGVIVDFSFNLVKSVVVKVENVKANFIVKTVVIVLIPLLLLSNCVGKRDY